MRWQNENVDILPNNITVLCGGTIEQFTEQDRAGQDSYVAICLSMNYKVIQYLQTEL